MADNESQNVLTKMSVKTLKCKPARAKADEKTIPLCRIKGVARGIKTAVGQGGDTVYGLTGNFHGVNLETKEEFTSGVLYLPGGIQELILEPIDAMLDGGDKNAAVTFAFDIFANPDGNPAGYNYSAVNLVPAKAADPFAEINAALEGKSLPAPAKPAAASAS